MTLAGCVPPTSNPVITESTREQIAQALKATGDSAAAATVLSGGEARQPQVASKPDPIYEATLLVDTGHPAEGMALAKSALAARGDDPNFALEVARLAIKAGELKEATEIYQQILPRHPDNVEAWNGMGVIYAQQGNMAAATDSLHQALGLSPNNKDARYNLALVTLLSGDLGTALAMLQALAISDPSDRVTATLALAQQRLRATAASDAAAQSQN